MPRKKKEETLEDVLAQMAEALKEAGENNFAIVMYSYLGARKIGLDGYFARHCQEFVKEQMPELQKTLKRKNN